MSFGLTASSAIDSQGTQSIRWAQSSAASHNSASVTLPASGPTAPQAGDIIVIMGARDDVKISAEEWDLGSKSLALSKITSETGSWLQAGAMTSAPLTASQATALAGTTISQATSDDNSFTLALLSGSSGMLDDFSPPAIDSGNGTATSATAASITTTDSNELVFASFIVGYDPGNLATSAWSTPGGYTILGSNVENTYQSLATFCKNQVSAGTTGTITANLPTGVAGSGNVAATIAGSFAFRNPFSPTGPAPSIRSWVNFSGGSSSSVTIDKPEGTASGDILVLIIAVTGEADTGHLSLPSGFTVVDRTAASGSTTTVVHPKMVVATKVASSEPSTYALSSNDNNIDPIGTLIAVRGSSGLHAYSTLLGHETPGTTSTTNGLTTTSNNCLIIQAHSTSAGQGPFTHPAGSNTLARGISSHDYNYCGLGVFWNIEATTVTNKTYTSVADEADNTTSVAIAFAP